MPTVLLAGDRYQPKLTLHHLTGTGLASLPSRVPCLLCCWSCGGTAAPDAEERAVFMFLSCLGFGWVGLVYLQEPCLPSQWC